MIIIFNIGFVGLVGSSVAAFIGKKVGAEKLRNRAEGIFALAFAATILNLPGPADCPRSVIQSCYQPK